MGSRRLISFVGIAAILVLALPAWTMARSATRVECGIFTYVAADQVTRGSIQFGGNESLGISGKRYDIEIGAPVPENLADIDGAPTCMSLTLKSGNVTSMEYAPSGSVRGPVTVYGDPVNDPTNSFYVTAGRVVTPTDAVNAYPGLQAILGNAALTGEDASITFGINTEFGVPVSFTAWTRLRGTVSMNGAGVTVGSGVLPEELVDDVSRSLLEKAVARGAYAKVEVTAQGTIDVNTGVLDVSTALNVRLVSSNPVSAAVGGPCAGSAYYGVFDNTSAAHATRFRLKWTTVQGTQVMVKSVPAGATYLTWRHWAKPGTLVQVSYLNAHRGRWVNLASHMAEHIYSAPCDYQPGLASTH